MCGVLFCFSDRKHSTKAQLPSLHNGATEDTGRVSAVNTFGGEGNFFNLLLFPTTPCFQSIGFEEDLEASLNFESCLLISPP